MCCTSLVNTDNGIYVLLILVMCKLWLIPWISCHSKWPNETSCLYNTGSYLSKINIKKKGILVHISLIQLFTLRSLSHYLKSKMVCIITADWKEVIWETVRVAKTLDENQTFHQFWYDGTRYHNGPINKCSLFLYAEIKFLLFLVYFLICHSEHSTKQCC